MNNNPPPLRSVLGPHGEIEESVVGDFHYIRQTNELRLHDGPIIFPEVQKGNGSTFRNPQITVQFVEPPFLPLFL